MRCASLSPMKTVPSLPTKMPCGRESLHWRAIAVGAVAALAGAHDGRDDAGFQVDPADGVALGVGEIEAAVGRPGDALGPGEPRRLGRTAVAGEPVSPVPATW